MGSFVGTFESKHQDREYPRYPGLDEIDHSDFVALSRAREQAVRDRAIDQQETRILRERLIECVRREDVNYPQRCREHAKAYMKAYKKYRSGGII